MQSGRPAVLQEWDNLVKDYPTVFNLKDENTLRVNIDLLGSIAIKLTNIFDLFIRLPASHYKIEIYRKSPEIPAVVEYTADRLFNFVKLCATEQICDDFLKLKSATLFSCLVSAAALHDCEFCYDTITNKVMAAMQSGTVKRSVIAENYFELVKLIYLMTERGDLIRKLIPELMKLLISFHCVEKLLFVDDTFKQFIIAADHPSHSFLHAAFDAAKADTNDRFNFNATHLMECYGEHPLIPYNDKGASLLAVCNQHEYYDLFFGLLKKNNPDYLSEMKTMMRAACEIGCMSKIQFLLRHDVDGKLIKVYKENFAKLPFTSSDCFRFFHAYKSNGKALSLPLESLPQRGFTCGFYAAHAATTFLRMLHKDQFTTEPLPPRRSDSTPRALNSLLGKAKQQAKTIIGEVYSAETMTEIIRYTECQSAMFEIVSEAQFLAVIQLAIQEDLPVLLPFPSGEGQNRGKANRALTADSAHWAVVIGYNDKCLLTAQYNQFIEDKIGNYYQAFYNIHVEIPETFYMKDDDHDWQSKSINLKPAILTKGQAVIEKVSLENFRRRLIIVLPPNHPTEKWRHEFEKRIHQSQPSQTCKL